MALDTLHHAANIFFITDSAVDITSGSKVMAAVANRTQAGRDVVIFPGTFGGALDPGMGPEVKRKTGGVGS